jgi:hypothetical protein
MWITNYLKGKMMSISDTINYDNNHLELDNSINSDYNTTAEKYSCWCFLFIDEVKIEARILHKGRGKFKIVEDKSNAKYVNKIVDASEVIRCKVNPSDVHKFERQLKPKIQKPIPRYILCSRCSSKIISISSPPIPLLSVC